MGTLGDLKRKNGQDLDVGVEGGDKVPDGSQVFCSVTMWMMVLFVKR